jgi:hypothetical protein
MKLTVHAGLYVTLGWNLQKHGDYADWIKAMLTTIGLYGRSLSKKARKILVH